MDYPKLSREGGYRLSIPALSGGLNLVGSLDTVKDNQLTDGRNVWYKDGLLRTRPAFHWKAARHPDANGNMSDVHLPDGSKLVFNQEIDGIQYLVYRLEGNKAQAGGGDTLYVYSVNQKGEAYPKSHFFACPAGKFDSVILYQGQKLVGQGLYAIVGFDTNQWGVWEYGDYKDGAGPYHWERITDETEGLYAPLILVNGKGNRYADLPSSGSSPYPNPVTFEGYNTLFGKFRAGYFADGMSYEFKLPCQVTADSQISITYTGRKKVCYTWEIPAGRNDSGTPSVSQQNIQAHIDRGNGLIWFTVGTGDATGTLPMVEGVPNSIVVTAVTEPENAPAWMRQALWFGGSSKGISGGSRLFMTGDQNQPGKLVWSDQGRPLYFPENCYAYVGDSSSMVTAMAKQEDMLVLFKENETYYTKYVDGPDYTADDILSGAIYDVTAIDAAFPIYQIHPAIGCSQPDSVRLCDNRLIWASNTGHVYTLVSSSIYSSVNIYRLTDQVGTIPDLVNGVPAIAGISNGWYFLFIGHIIYLMDYRSSAVRALTSYAKDRTPVGWYIWEQINTFPTIKAVLSSERDGLLLISFYGAQNSTRCIMGGAFAEDGMDRADGISYEFPAWFRTKLYDFGLPEKYKRVISLTFKAGGNGTIDIAFATERGQTPNVRHKELYASKAKREPGYLQIVKLMPAAPRVQQFGLQVSLKGRVSIGGVTIYYKTLR